MINFQFAQNLLASLTGGQAAAGTQTAGVNIVQALSKPADTISSEAPEKDFADSLKQAEPKSRPIPRRETQKIQPRENGQAHVEAPLEQREAVAAKHSDAVEQTNENSSVEATSEISQEAATSASEEASAENPVTPSTPALEQDVNETIKAAQDALQAIDALLALLGTNVAPLFVQQLQESKTALQGLVDGLKNIDVTALEQQQPAALAQLQQVLGQFAEVSEALNTSNQQLLNQGEFKEILATLGGPEMAALEQHAPFAKLAHQVATLEKHLSAFNKIATANANKPLDRSNLQPILNQETTKAEAIKSAQAAPQNNITTAIDAPLAQAAAGDEKILPFTKPEAKEAPSNPVVDSAKQQQAVQTQTVAAVQQANEALASSATNENNQGASRVVSTSGAPHAAPIATAATQQKAAAHFEGHIRQSEKGSASEQVAFYMKSMVKDGMSKMIVKLDPPELGALEIKMQTGRDGKTGIVIQVERPETLDLLQKDSRFLQQALHDAGLKTDSGSLSFNLRGGDSGGQQRQGNNPYPAAADDIDEELLTVVSERYVTEVQHGVNIRI